MVPFLHDDQDVSPKSRKKLLNLLETQSDKLQIELAVDIDAGEPFVKGTYALEGDGPLALKCFDIINEVKAAVQVHHWPNTTAVAKRIANQLLTEQNWLHYASSCVRPRLDYFTAKFDGEVGELRQSVAAFRSATSL